MIHSLISSLLAVCTRPTTPSSLVKTAKIGTFSSSLGRLSGESPPRLRSCCQAPSLTSRTSHAAGISPCSPSRSPTRQTESSEIPSAVTRRTSKVAYGSSSALSINLRLSSGRGSTEVEASAERELAKRLGTCSISSESMSKQSYFRVFVQRQSRAKRGKQSEGTGRLGERADG